MAARRRALSSTASDTGLIHASVRHRQASIFSLTRLNLAVLAYAPKTGLACLTPVEKAGEDGEARLFKAGPSVLLQARCSKQQGRRPAAGCVLSQCN